MRLSTSTNMLYPVQRAEHSLDTIRTLGAAGFQVLDWCATAFSNQDTVRGENPFTTSEWQGWIGAQRNEADKLGIVQPEQWPAPEEYDVLEPNAPFPED